MPTNMQSSLIFHYNLKLYDSDQDKFDDVSLKRVGLITKCEEFLSKNKNVETFKVINSFNEMINQVNNIARIVIDEE